MEPVEKIRRNPPLQKILGVTVGLYVCLLIVGAGVVYFGFIAHTRSQIHDVVTRAKNDVVFKDGIWNTSHYDTDPEIPGPFRTYVISKDGFVIDRWRPIFGYLDTSNFKQLLGYKTPRSLHTATNQDWRLLSKPIGNGHNGVAGVVTVGHLGTENISNIDKLLETTASKLLSEVRLENGEISTDNVNFQDVPYNVSFQVVDQYNRIQLKSDNASSIDRLPSFIDSSYITEQLKKPMRTTVTDAKNSERFAVESAPITDINNQPVGTIIVARSIGPAIALARLYILVFGILGLILTILASMLTVRLYGNKKLSKNSTGKNLLTLSDIQSIKFHKDQGAIQINDEQIPLTYATNQYYIGQTLLGSPKKKWENDELLEKIGDDNMRNWRKIYDAMNSINKKAADVMEPRLIVASNKTYQINPKLVTKINKS